MLVIRLQRTGRSGHAQFRVVVQDSRFSPSSGRVVAYVGSYNPHTKQAELDKEKIEQFLKSGAQPSDRAAKLLEKDGIKLPAWFKASSPGKREVRNPDKRRSTRPEGAPEPPKPEAAAEPAAEGAEPAAAESAADEAPAEAPPAEAES